MMDPKQPNLLLDIGTDSENESVDGRVGKPLRDVRRYSTFIRDVLALAETQRLFFWHNDVQYIGQ